MSKLTFKRTASDIYRSYEVECDGQPIGVVIKNWCRPGWTYDAGEDERGHMPTRHDAAERLVEIACRCDG